MACVRWLVTGRGPVVVPPLVVAEACYLIGRHLGAEAEAVFLDALGPGQPFVQGDLEAIRRALRAFLLPGQSALHFKERARWPSPHAADGDP